MRSKLLLAILCVIMSGCFSSRKIITDNNVGGEEPELASICSNPHYFTALYMNKIKAFINIDGEKYEAKISLYYIPDSIIFLTAANTGFEIVRAAIMPDSAIFINRIDKVVYITKNNRSGYKAPIDFMNMEYLLNKNLVCERINETGLEGGKGIVDFSVKDINKKISYEAKTLRISKFEFFHKKTSEYVVGELRSGDTLFVYSNYIFDNVEITAVGGEIAYDNVINIDLSFNENKYIILKDK